MKKRIIAAITALSVITSAAAVAAFGVQRTIDVTGGISVFMDGNEVEMTDVNGNAVDAFVYDGTTYLPARAISEANGNTVSWDGQARRVDIKSNEADSENTNAARLINQEDRYFIFDLSDNVTRTEVTYTNRYGIELAADLYTSADIDETQQYPAIVIGPPYGGVKEQGPGVYANELAQRGFVVLAFDPSYNGESGGEPRHLSSPEIFSEDFSAGVDFLGSLDYVDREKIAALGICGSGGIAISAAAMDTRIKAVVTSAMYDISAMGNSLEGDEREEWIDGFSQQRWADFENGTPAYTRTYPADAPLEELPDDLTGTNIEWWTFYGLERGWHPNSGGSFTNTSMLPFSNYSLLNHIEEISPRPIMFITGDIAHSRSMSEEFYEMAAEPKELVIVPGAMHIDLYDRVDLIPFDEIEIFLNEAFN